MTVMNVRALLRGERGAVMVETAIVLALVLVPLLMMVIDLGRVIHVRHVLTQATREGAVAIVHSQGGSASLVASAATASVNQALQQGDLDTSKSTITLTYPTTDSTQIAVSYSLSGFTRFAAAFFDLPAALTDSAVVNAR